MKYIQTILAAVAVVLLLCSVPVRAQDLAPTVSLDYSGLGQELVTFLSKGDFTAAGRNFDATMKSAMPPAKLSEVWQALQEQVGKFKRQTGVRTAHIFPFTIVYVTCDFIQMPIDIQITYNEVGKVAGLFFVPTQFQAKYRLPDYAARPGTYVEKELIVGSSEWALSATLTLPNGKGPFPALVLVHGSGPQDRDETYGPNKPFRDLAYGFVSRGIAVLRYEKRTRQHGAKMALLKDHITVKEETIDDALAAVALLRGREEINHDRVFVLGHSLGGMLLPRIGWADPAIAGLIVFAGNTRPLEDLILDQIDYLFNQDGVVTAAERIQLETIKMQVARVKGPALSDSTPAAELPLGVPAGYWLDLRGYQPSETAKNLKMPMLILRGERDYQVTTADFEGWQKSLSVRADVEFKSYPKLNHFFIEGKGEITPAEYDLAGNIPAYVIEDIAAWVMRHYR